MSKVIIMPLSKMPCPDRIGPLEWADWYRGCVVAVEIQKELEAQGVESELLVLTAARLKTYQDEWFYYSKTLRDLAGSNLRVIRKCYETVEQIEMVTKIARDEGKRLIIVATWLHYLRVKWLLRGTGIELHAVFGMPNAYYTFGDVILTIVFPFIDVCPRGRDWWRTRTIKRRLKLKY